MPDPHPGLPEYQERAALEVPGGRLNVAGGNLLIRRVDLAVDTFFGTLESGATYNSATGAWTWSFELRYEGDRFVDEKGTVHDLSRVAHGEAIPGTTWVRLTHERLQTKGGLVYVFENGRLARMRWKSSGWPHLVVKHADVAGRMRPVAVLQCTAPGTCTRVFDYSYDGAGEPAAVVDRAGRVATFQHVGSRLARAQDAFDHAHGLPGFRYAYDGEGRIVSLVSSEGERSEYTYRGDRIATVRAVGPGDDPTYRFAYRRVGERFRTRFTDPLGHAFLYEWDRARRLRSRRSVETGELTTFQWSGRRPVRRTDPNGATTLWAYADDDPVERTEPSGNRVRFTYARHAENREEPRRRPLAVAEDDLGLIERRIYDAKGRLVEKRNGEDEVVLALTWRSDGTIASRRTPYGRFEYGSYGVHGHPLSIRQDDVDVPCRYDAVGNRIRGCEEGATPGGVLERHYDADRNLARVVVQGSNSDDPQAIRIAYRSDGRIRAVRRPGGGDHVFVYDARGRLIARRERAEDQWHVTHVTYDAAGRPVAQTRPNGMRQVLELDAQGRPTRIRWLRGQTLESRADLTWRDGQLVEVLDSTHGAPERYRYDAAGRVAEVVHPSGERRALMHDLRSRLLREVYEMGSFSRVIRRSWDRADREVALFDGGDRLVRRHYAGGRLVGMDTGNGLSRRFSWDPESGILLTATTRDAAGNLVEQTRVEHEVFTSTIGIHAETSTYARVQATTNETYLLSPTHGSDQEVMTGHRLMLWSDGESSEFYTWDALSRRLGDGTHTRTWDAQGQRLLSLTSPRTGGRTIHYRHDAAGFVTERDGLPLTWTASGRLQSWGDRVELGWDAFQRPVSRRVDGVSQSYLFGGRVAAHPLGIPSELDLGEVKINLISGSRLYRHRDFRQNVKFVTNDAGEVVTHYRYHPYGVHEVLGQDVDGRRFVGGTDLGGLTMIGSRVLDPLSGRFLSPDPVFSLINNHAYTLGNPVWFVDPDGRRVTTLRIFEGFSTETLVHVKFAADGVALYSALNGNAPAAVGFGLIGTIIGYEIALRAVDGPGGPNGLSSPEMGGGMSVVPSLGCTPTTLASVPRLPFGATAALAWIALLLAVEMGRHVARSR